MAIPESMKNIIRLFSDNEPDITKSYKLERFVKHNIKGHPILTSVLKGSDTDIECDGRNITVRVCTPVDHDSSCRTAILFFHGGGWVTENIDTYTEVCINLANFTGCKVIAVEYGLAPEHPFPEGLEDCYSAAKAVITDPSVVGVDADEIVLAGDSAGGNLAAAVSLMARDKGEFKVSRQILIYPAVNNDYSENSKYRSVIENGTDYILTAKRISEYVSLYAACEEDMQNPYFAPILAKDLSDQPDTMIITAEFDPLRDEGEDYGRKLKQAGNNVKIYRMKNTLHGFISLSANIKPVGYAYKLISDYIHKV